MRSLLFIIILSIPPLIQPQIIWQPTEGPYGGSIGQIKTDWWGNLYAGAGTKAFRREIGSDRWIQLGNGLPGSIAFAFDSNKIYIYSALGEPDKGIYRSPDNGKSWTRIMNGHNIIWVYNLGVTQQGTLLSATSDGIFRSTDHGDNWSYRGLGPLSIWCFANDPKSSMVFAGTAWGMYYSIDDGLSWMAAANQGLSSATIYSLVTDGYHIIAGTDDKIYKSTDMGTYWWQTGPNDILSAEDLAWHPNGNIYSAAYSGAGVYYSTDTGESWLPITNGLLYNRYWISIAIDFHDDIYVGSNGCAGVFKSTDNGNSWFDFNRGITRPIVTTIYVHNDGEIFAGTRGAGVYCTTDGGDNWFLRNNGLTHGSIWKITRSHHSDALFLLASRGGVFRSTDQGESWHTVNDGITLTWTLRDIITASNEYMYICGENFGICRSTDQGLTWHLKNNGLPYTKWGWGVIELPDQKLLTAINSNGIYISTDQGEQWFNSSNGLTDKGIFSLFSPGGNIVFAGTNSGIFRSSDGGASWTNVLSSVTRVNDFICDPKGNIYAATSFYGTYASTNLGLSWFPINDGLTNMNVECLAIDSNDHLWSGLTWEVAHRSVNPLIGIKEDKPIKADRIILHQNYPNPFNPATTIQYRLPKKARTTLAVYNLLGQKVRTLVNENKESGYYSVVWDGKDEKGNCASSGIYLYRLKTGSMMITKKMILVR